MELKYRKALGRAIRRLRIQAGITQEGLGFEAGLERSYVSSVELASKDPSFSTIQKIATALNTSMADLFQIYEEELRSPTNEPPRRRGRPSPKT
ncbi:helix-turn-helix domain-containing protein [Herbaspirillum sp.]|uniref:helix-turn-helix domain-containing protein n=1 Tax=Herbaspirillum sp. TaxID=1890675 RepID=UPI0039C89197